MTANVIASVHNERIKRARALRNRREREERGLLCIEGPRFIMEALGAGASISACFYVDDGLSATERRLLQQLQERGADVVPVTGQVMASLADTTTPQGMVAVAKAPEQKGPAVLVPGGLVLVADRVQDPGNLGTMLRTAAAVGAGLIMLAGCTDHTGPKVVRGSAGACYAVPLWVGPTEDMVIAELRKAAYKTFVLEMGGALSLFSADLRGSVALVVGNEGSGPSAAWRAAGARFTHIPMPGRVESLNAGVAAAVVLYEALRQRGSGC